MLFGRRDLAFELHKNRPRLCFYPTQENTFVHNLVPIGRATAEKSWREKKTQIDRKVKYYQNFEKLHFFLKTAS